MSDELENGFSFCEWGSTADIPRSFLEDDVGGLHELKLVSRLYKVSPEQVERHLVSESLSDIDRALLLVRTGSIVQQTSVFRDFLRLYRVHSPAETFPVIHAALVVPSALEKIEYTHPPASRIWNAKVLVAAIVRLSKTLPQQEPLVVTLLHLCQDTDHEVRMCLCQQLSSIARVTSGETCAKLVAPELLELLNDEEPHVRAAAVGVLADIATSVAAVSDCCGRLLAAAMRLCRDSNPLVRQALAEELGPVFWALKDHLSSSDTQTLQHLLHSLCTSHNASLTCQGLHSLPALLRMNAVGADNTWITAIMTQLSMSPELSVRIKVAQVFHAVAEALEGRSAEILLPSFHLLLDEQSAVFVPFAQHLDATLSHLCSGNPNRDTPELLLPIVRKAGALVRSHAWRDQLALLQQTHHFEEYFDLEMLQDTWIPILLQLMAIVCIFMFSRRHNPTAY
ncbi:Serine/threonine-protein phosphatase 4 regulatory subunit 4 [Sorochytrium milnesiophthora]